jgi:hypothetical protein
MQFLKSIFLSKNGKDLIEMKKEFRYLFDQLDDNAMEVSLTLIYIDISEMGVYISGKYSFFLSNFVVPKSNSAIENE